MNRTVLISDMHLSADSADLNALFRAQLQNWAGKIDALYLLGDVFDAWIGDDEPDATLNDLIAAMHAFSRHTPLFVMRGNRDFLLGADFAQRSGATLLDDPYLADFYGKKWLLTHGDAMCTDDVPYQQFRAQSRNPLWQAAVLAKPLAERKMLAAQIRAVSEHKKGDADQYEISDVTEAGLQALQAQLGADAPQDVIHGHTHRPQEHQHQYNGHHYRRFVLQDWHNGQGGCLNVYADGSVSAERF
ncbi:MAG: UDP-2,3-diacylglucosamine diphosphatase [Neisseria sp.]|nr:UDP-2,3-diacylglucosamine diphosphatase [Neisseria sp.]